MKKIFLAFSILLLATPFQAFAFGLYAITDGSVQALYHFSDNTDSSGNGYTLTNNGSIPFVPAFLGSGASSSVNTQWFSNGSSILGSQTYSEVFLFKWSGIQPVGQSDLITWGTNNNEVSLHQNGGTEKIDYYDGTEINSTASIATGTMYELVISKSGAAGVLTMWLNGSLDSQNVVSNLAPSPPTLLNTTAHGGVLIGLMDETVITNNVLTTSTVQSLWNSGNPLQVCVIVGCANAATNAVHTIRGNGRTRTNTGR